MIPLTRRFALRGDCMLPLLEPGDEVWVRPGPVSGKDRLVAYARLAGPVPEIVVHRLLDARGPVTRADALSGPDPAAERAALIGPVAAFRRGRRLVLLSGRRARLYDALALFWARAVLAPLFRGRAYDALRGLLLAPPRALFAALFGPP